MTLLHTNTRKFGEPYGYEAVHNPAVLRTEPIKDCAWTNAQNRTRHTHARMDIHTESHMHTHARMDMHRIAHAHTHMHAWTCTQRIALLAPLKHL